MDTNETSIIFRQIPALIYRLPGPSDRGGSFSLLARPQRTTRLKLSHYIFINAHRFNLHKRYEFGLLDQCLIIAGDSGIIGGLNYNRTKGITQLIGSSLPEIFRRRRIVAAQNLAGVFDLIWNKNNKCRQPVTLEHHWNYTITGDFIH
jgi:hypothetical protein